MESLTENAFRMLTMWEIDSTDMHQATYFTNYFIFSGHDPLSVPLEEISTQNGPPKKNE